MQHLSRPRRPDAAHVSAGDAANGVVPGMPPRAGKESPPARSGIQHALPATHHPKPSGGGWPELHRASGSRFGSGKEIQRANRERHYELQHLPSMKLVAVVIKAAAKRRKNAA